MVKRGHELSSIQRLRLVNTNTMRCGSIGIEKRSYTCIRHAARAGYKTHLGTLKYLFLCSINIAAIDSTDDVWLFSLQTSYCCPEDALAASACIAEAFQLPREQGTAYEVPIRVKQA